MPSTNVSIKKNGKRAKSLTSASNVPEYDHPSLVPNSAEWNEMVYVSESYR
jgi:hypothetical protein